MSHRSGQALAEMALIMPLFILLCVATISFGKWFLIHQKLLTGVRQAALLYSSGRVKKSEARRSVLQFLTTGHPSLESDRTTIEIGRWNGGWQATLFHLDEIRIHYRPASPLLRMFSQDMEEKCVIKHAPHYGPPYQTLYGPAVPW